MLSLIISKIFFFIHFKVVNIIFKILNYFKRKDSVEKPEDVLVLISATDAAEMIRIREITSFDLISAYIERIKIVDPMINAVVSNNFDEALRLAEKVDLYLDKLDKNSDEYLNLKNTKPLLGVPFTVKDTFSVTGFPWSAGVYNRKDKFAIEDAELVKRVKESGSILLAITNVPEAAMWFETNNQIYGRTNNPYDLRRCVGGSSGGEAALIAAAGSIFGIGSDIGGSIRIPSIFNGVFGLKTTEMTIPQTGQYPRVDPGSYKERMLSLGPICRYAKDLPLLLKVFVGEETANGSMKLDQPVSLRKTRFFYMEGLHSLEIQPLQNATKNALKKTVKYFEKKYDTPVYKIEFLKAQHSSEFYSASMQDDNPIKFKHLIADCKYEVPIYWEMLKCAIGKSRHTAAGLMVAFFDDGNRFLDEKLRFILSKRDELRREIIELLGEDGLLIFPAWPTVAPFHNQSLFTPFDFAYTGIFNSLRLPVVVCPLGFNSEDVPTAVQIVASPFSEKLLMAAAADLEEGFGGWKPPRGTKSEYD